MSVRRIFVEKKPEFAVLAHDLKEEIASYLGIDTITDVRRSKKMVRRTMKQEFQMTRSIGISPWKSRLAVL